MPLRTAIFVTTFALSIAVGRATVLPTTQLALFWPAAGVAALWGMLAVSRRETVAVGVLVALLSGGGSALTGFPLGPAMILGVSNTAIALGCRGVLTALRRRGSSTGEHHGLTRLQDLYRLVAATILAVTGSAAFGMLGLAAAGKDPTVYDAVQWVVRNAAAVVVIAGPGLVIRDTAAGVRRRDLRRALPIVATTVLALWLAFGPGNVLPLGFVPIALVLWAALRLPPPLAAAHGLFVAVGTFALVRSTGGGALGQIADDSALAVTLQAYMLVVVGSALVIATVQWERDQLLDEVARAALDAQHQADHDALTGLPNRRRLETALETHQRRIAVTGPTGALLLVDLDHFKEVNDTLGHDAGDQLLVGVSELVRGSLRSTDIVARLGGDEFAVLLPEADQAGARAVAEGIVERVRTWTADLDGVRRRVTASIGVATFAGAAQQGLAPLVLADMLLYDAKEAGRNRLADLDPAGSQQPRSRARLDLLGRLDAALETDAFEVHLQPILDLRTDRIVAAEALLRLADGAEPVSAACFVEVAERAGRAPDLDRWVIRHATALLAQLGPDVDLEVNLSARSIGDPHVELEIVHALRRHDIAPGRLVVEVTETAAIADLRAAAAFHRRLSAAGVRIAIDDFGVGFGSFYHLKHLPFDVVKIDGEFVASASTSAEDQAILRSIVQVAHDLGKSTVAEFVADDAALDTVRSLGVDQAQGHVVGRAVPVEEFVSTHQGRCGRASPESTAGVAARSALVSGARP